MTLCFCLEPPSNRTIYIFNIDSLQISYFICSVGKGTSRGYLSGFIILKDSTEVELWQREKEENLENLGIGNLTHYGEIICKSRDVMYESFCFFGDIHQEFNKLAN